MNRWQALLTAILLPILFGLGASVTLALSLDWPLTAAVPWLWYRYVWAMGWTSAAEQTAVVGAVFALVGPLALLARRDHAYFGNARFARSHEVRAAGLKADEGLIMGRQGSKLLRDDGSMHLLTIAPTGGGKGVGVVLPNCLTWPGSALVMDIKYENFELTSGYRAQHQFVYRFSPADPEVRSHRYNPFDAVRPGIAHRVSDLQRLASILVPNPGGSRDAFWQQEARSLFVGLALYILDTDVPHTLGQLYRTLMAEQSLSDIVRHLLRTRTDLDPVCRAALGSFANKADKEQSGVRSTLTAALNLWANPVIDAATSESDFDLGDLRRKPITVYVAVSLDQLPSLAPLLSLFFQQAMAILAQARPGPDEPHQVLFLLDEFASLGRMDVLKDSLAFLRGFAVRICTILQGLGQLDDIYGRAGRESILQNSGLQLLYTANDDTTAEYASERCGTKTIQTMSRNVSTDGRSSRTYSYTGRKLMLSEEVRQLGTEEALLFKEAMRPARVAKVRHYKDRRFRKRLLPPVEVPQMELKPMDPPTFELPKDENAKRKTSELDQLRDLSMQLDRLTTKRAG
jgi:type IV secretion system protein VirD4